MTTLVFSRRSWLPAAAVVVVTVLLAVLRMVVTPGYYFADDTQLGSLGQWYELGDRLLRGELPVLDPRAWQAGNYYAEGQWGLLNPINWIVSIAVRLSPSSLLVISAVKVLWLAVMALGVYLLARSFGAAAGWAALAGVSAPLGGFTAYMDAPSWVNGLITTALFPWAWWAYRRVVAGQSPWPFFVASYLLVSVGYVFGVIVLAFVLIESLVREGLLRHWSAFRRGVFASLWAGLWTVVIFLPGILTAPVTDRGALFVVNGGFLNADLSDLGAASTPTASATIGAFFGPVTAAPLVYVAWFLPLLALFAPKLRQAWRGLLPVAVLGGIALALVLGPSDIGPIRWPIRFMPFLVIATMVIIAVLATHGYPRGVSRKSVMASVLIAVGMNWLTWAVTPQSWRSIAVCLLIQLVSIVVFALAATQGERWPRPLLRAPGAVLVFSIVVTTLFVGLQMRVFPVTPLPTFAVPSTATSMTSVLDDVDGDVMTVGDAVSNAMDPTTYEERLIANLWYLSSAKVSNTYTVLPYSTFSDDLCIDLKGNTCDRALDRLFSIDSDTGERVVDLLAIDQILGYKTTYPAAPRSLPEGWHLVQDGSTTWRLARDSAIEGAGGVVWTGPGTEVETTSSTDTSVTLRVGRVGSDPRVVLSRLDYPGYVVEGASTADPVRKYLLTIDLDSVAPGSTVTVTFRPPGFAVEVGSAFVAVFLLISWSVLRLRARRIERQQATAVPLKNEAD